MSASAQCVSEAVQRVGRRDPTLTVIFLSGKQHTDAELAELVDCLLAHPDVVKRVYLTSNQLTDETGIKLARYVAASSTIEWLDLSHNQLGPGTYLALAAALRVNSSLRDLYLYGNQAVDQTRINAASSRRCGSIPSVRVVLVLRFDRLPLASACSRRAGPSVAAAAAGGQAGARRSPDSHAAALIRSSGSQPMAGRAWTTAAVQLIIHRHDRSHRVGDAAVGSLDRCWLLVGLFLGFFIDYFRLFV